MRKPVPVCLAAFALALVVASDSARAADSVHLAVRGKDTVKGTLRPAGDRELFICGLARGAQLTASAKPTGKNGPTMGLELDDSLGNDKLVPVTVRNKAATITRFVLGETGLHSLVVRGDGVHDGDYLLSISWTFRTLWTGSSSATSTPLAAGATTSFQFAAPAGASASITLSADRNKDFVPDLVSMTGTTGPAIPLGDGAKAANEPCAVLDEYTVSFRNNGVAAGNWKIQVRLTVPRVLPDKFDLRDGVLAGTFSGDHTVVGGVVGPTGGNVDVGTQGSSIDGSSVSIPPNSLGSPTVVTIAATDQFFVSGTHGAGPAVEFGPAGTVFDPSGANQSKQALVTIPFDPAYFPGGTANLVIKVRHADGTIASISPITPIQGNVVSFYAADFTTFMATTTDPRPLEGNFLLVGLLGTTQTSFGGDVGINVAQVSANGGRATVANDRADLAWRQTLTGAGPTFALTTDLSQEIDGVTVASDSKVSIATQNGTQTFLRGASDDVLVGADSTFVLLRRPTSLPTPATLAGTWHVYDLSFDVTQGGAQNITLDFEDTYGTGTFTDAGNGGGTLTYAIAGGKKTNSDFPAGSWKIAPPSDSNVSAKYIVQEGAVLVTTGQGNVVRFDPALNGDVLVAHRSSTTDNSIELIMLVRTSKSFPSRLVGSSSMPGLVYVPTDAANTAGGVQDIVYEQRLDSFTFNRDGTFTRTGTSIQSSHDAQGNPMTTPSQDGPETNPFSFRPDGSATDAAHDTKSVVSPSRALIVHGEFRGDRYQLQFGVFTPQ